MFCEFTHQTHSGSWSQPRRVVAKAEQIEGKENPRFVVTNLRAEAWPAQDLYKRLYCARGEMENRIKEQVSLLAIRISAATLRADQLLLVRDLGKPARVRRRTARGRQAPPSAGVSS